MYDLAPTVAACLAAGTPIDVIWPVETSGFSSLGHNEALAVTADGSRIGSLFSGALDSQLSALTEDGRSGRLLDLRVGEHEAAACGLSCGGDARLIMMPAADAPTDLWTRLVERKPVIIVNQLDDERVVRTEAYGEDGLDRAPDAARQLFDRGTSVAGLVADLAITVLWPVPSLIILGGGAIATELTTAAEALGWRPRTFGDASAAADAISALTPIDKAVVMSHDVEVAGPVLLAALDSRVGYVGALGSRQTQAERTDWLRGRGVTEAGLRRLHGPAGLDIGAKTPAEVAIAIVAEALAVAAGRSGGSLRDGAGPIHPA